MASPNYQPVSKSKFDVAKGGVPDSASPRIHLAAGIRALFDEPEFEAKQVNLKKDDTLALADRLEAEGGEIFSFNERAIFVEMLESLKE